MKKYIIIIIASISGGITSFMHSAVFFEQTQKPSQRTAYTFELMNKSSKPIWVELSCHGSPLSKRIGVGPMVGKDRGYLRSPNIDTTRHLNVSIYQFANATDPIKESHIYADGKTIYLTWDGNTLRPQTGPLLGLTSKTQSGLSLKNNVTIDDIDPHWQLNEFGKSD
ncbi:MAG TPA: hypothetical protein VEK38_02125 [Candidatus Bathyarchaeia archaeon]|nr:hypothetical protein [Candidatus Bathyarchaeia archaeon]